MKYHEKTSLIFFLYLFQRAYNKRVDDLFIRQDLDLPLLPSEHIEETFHYLDRKATNQLDTLMKYMRREWIRNRTRTGPDIIKLFWVQSYTPNRTQCIEVIKLFRNPTRTPAEYKMAIFRVIIGACSKWQPTRELLYNNASKSPASTPTGLSGYVESTRRPWGGGNIRKISFSSRNYLVPHRFFTWSVPTQTEELPLPPRQVSCACGFLTSVPCTFWCRFPLMIKELCRQVLKRRCSEITSLCG